MIQPHPLLSELMDLSGDDGLIDRFLFFVAKPIFYPFSLVKENFASLKMSKMQSFEKMFVNIYQHHLHANKVYHLSETAESFYMNMMDQYSEFITSKYDGYAGKL